MLLHSASPASASAVLAGARIPSELTADEDDRTPLLANGGALGQDDAVALSRSGSAQQPGSSSLEGTQQAAQPQPSSVQLPGSAEGDGKGMVSSGRGDHSHIIIWRLQEVSPGQRHTLADLGFA